MSITNLWIIRHGETNWNLERRLQGWTDINLNQRGIEQAENLARYLRHGFFSNPPDHIYASDLQRAYITAQAVANQFAMNVTQIHGLRERHYGIFEGQSWELLKNLQAQNKCSSSLELSEQEHKAESLSVFYQRIQETLHTLARQHAGQTLLLFSHGGAIDMMWRIAMGLDSYAARKVAQKNTAINHLQIDPNLGMHVKQWGFADHIVDSL